MRTKDKKFIYSSREDHECYNLKADPQELNNLYPKTNGFENLFRYAEIYYRWMDEFYQKNMDNIEGIPIPRPQLEDSGKLEILRLHVKEFYECKNSVRVLHNLFIFNSAR